MGHTSWDKRNTMLRPLLTLLLLAAVLAAAMAYAMPYAMADAMPDAEPFKKFGFGGFGGGFRRPYGYGGGFWLVKIYFSAAHILSRKGMKGMKPSSSSGSQSSFMRPLASSLVSFSPRLVRRRKSSFPIMVLSSFLS